MTKYRADIDGLRAVAILAVILFHLDYSLFKGGFVGVDIFFVISGFLITRNIYFEIKESKSFAFKRFYMRRARRLAPALLFTLFFCSVFSVLLLSPHHLEVFGKSLMAAAGSVSNVLFWSESSYFDVQSNVKPLLHTWSLSVEEQFYFIWPVTLYLFFRIFDKKYFIFLLVLFFLLSYLGNVYFEDGFMYFSWLGDAFSNGASTIFYLLPFRIFEFTIGASLIFFEKFSTRSVKLNNILFIAGSVLIFYSISSFSEEIVFPYYNALLPCLGAALIIFSNKSFFSKVLLENRVMIKLGLISYSLYLIHWPMIVFWGYWTFEPLSLSEKPLILVLSVFSASLMYKYIETPFREKRVIE